LVEFSPLTSRFLLLTRCDVRQCAYTFITFLSPTISIVLYVMRVHLLYLKIFRPLGHNTKLLFYSDDYRTRWASHPLQPYNENHHHEYVIIVHAHALIHTWSIYIYMDKRRNAYKWKKKANKREDLTSQLKSNIMYRVVKSDKTRCCLTHHIMI
jgi:hypothetical protein